MSGEKVAYINFAGNKIHETKKNVRFIRERKYRHIYFR